MTLRIGEPAPDFVAETTEGTISLHEWMEDKWLLLFSHPKDFTPVCTTELGALAEMKGEFDARDCKVLGLSVDPVEDHQSWGSDIADVTGVAPNFPIVGDSNLAVAKMYRMLPDSAGSSSDGRTATENATVRTVYLIGPDKQIKAAMTYPMSTGRNFDEILRLLTSCQLTAKWKVATPANWFPGEEVIIIPSLVDSEASKLFPHGWRAPKPYIRFVEQPTT